MLADFSEFTYGFALAHELINNSSRIVYAAPVFPSLLEEGRTGGGYDVKINFQCYPLFIQFKLSEYMKNSNSKEWDVYREPYYRFSIWPSSKSKQHNLLLQLEVKCSNVFYAAPTIHKEKDFNKAFVEKNLVKNSVFFSPSTIGILPDNNQHRVIYQPNSSIGYFCSDPIKINVINGENFINSLNKIHHGNRLIDGYESIMKLGKELLVIAAKEMGYKWEDINSAWFTALSKNPLRAVSYIARVIFNCDFYLIRRNVQSI